jgi:hypothetical protein
MEKLNDILETYLMPNGLEIDLDEGFAKLTERQFGGNPGRAFSELIQNSIDSYPTGTPWSERYGEIEKGRNWISIRDYGEGMSTERLKLLITLGGSDKYKDPEKIGQFGMGFMAMFNNKLGTKKVIVITRCEGHTVQLIFHVKAAGKRPDISLSVLKDAVQYSTLIRVEFDYADSVKSCLEYARKSLTYYPCKIKIDGDLFVSQWEKYGSKNNVIFNENNCHGLIRTGNNRYNITVLCKYECITNSSLNFFITGGHSAHNNLQDFYSRRMPYVPGIEIVLNINKLRVTISRDSYYMDWAYNEALDILTKHLKSYLLKVFENGIAYDIIMANQFILRNEIASYLKERDVYHNNPSEANQLIIKLANAAIYRINGRSGAYSLTTLYDMKRSDFPFYYSPQRTNLRWLGGSFKHDFIVIPEKCRINGGADHFFDCLFSTIFNDVVNLDTIQGDPQKIIDLVKREIISKSALSPRTKILGPKNLNLQEQSLLNEIEALLCDSGILNVIEENLHLKLKSIKPIFFSLEETGLRISTGLFDEAGRPLNDDYISNIVEPAEGDAGRRVKRDQKIKLLLGLSLDHPFIRYLVSCGNPQRNYYALTYLAHELALCQKMLVPYSPFYHLDKQKLALEMRMALSKNLLGAIRN